jgi:hypothetical protein
MAHVIGLSWSRRIHYSNELVTVSTPFRRRPLFLLLLAALLAAAFLAIGATATSWTNPTTGEQPYNLLAQGFASGRLDLPYPVPQGLLRLRDPYDPAANIAFRAPPYRLHDLSLYRGRLYLYFGPAPALLLFWPWHALTGGFISQHLAVGLFAAAGFFLAFALVLSVWRRESPEVPAGVPAALAFGAAFATGAPLLLQRGEMWEVPVACGNALLFAALGAAWRARQSERRQGLWLALVSLACGLAVGARPSLGVAAIVVLGWSALAPGALRASDGAGKTDAPRRVGANALRLSLPFAACLLALLAYNHARFGAWLDFGQRWQLADDRQDVARHFSPGFLPFNLRVYFLRPAEWNLSFPFFTGLRFLVPSTGHAPAEDAFGILACAPFALLALACPLSWKRRPRRFGAALHPAVLATCTFLGVGAVLWLFYGTTARYEFEFLSLLIFLACLGTLALERAFTGRRIALILLRCGWSALLAYSVAFNLLSSAWTQAHLRDELGVQLLRSGRAEEAIPEFRDSLRWDPRSSAVENDLGSALGQSGRYADAANAFRESIRRDPGDASAHRNLAVCLVLLGDKDAARREEAVAKKLQPSLPPVPGL